MKKEGSSETYDECSVHVRCFQERDLTQNQLSVILSVSLSILKKSQEKTSSASFINRYLVTYIVAILLLSVIVMIDKSSEKLGNARVFMTVRYYSSGI